MDKKTEKRIIELYKNRTPLKRIIQITKYKKTTIYRILRRNNVDKFKPGELIKGRVAWNKGLTKHTSKSVKLGTEKSHKARLKNGSYKVNSGCFKKGCTGDKCAAWKGGKFIDEDGYVKIHKPEHPLAPKLGYIQEHRLVIEKQLGRYLKPEEIVHHINEIKNDNRIENLKLFSNTAEHSKYHANIDNKKT